MTIHIYIFNYGTGSILHTTLPDTVIYSKDINLMAYLGLNEDECDYMLSDKELTIEELEN